MKLHLSSLGIALSAVMSVYAENQTPELHGLPQQVFWGDTHLHTSWSSDASLMGTTVTPDNAYRFARGETVTSSDGVQVTIDRPLDFLVVADHAKPMLHHPGLVGGDAPRWRQVCTNADRFNDPGRFTTFSGYEWTPSKPRVHRVVVFADVADKACQLPFFSAETSSNVEDLWSRLNKYEHETGGRVLAISHGANQSRGTQFALKDYNGKDLDKNYAETRSRWETLYEVTQTKGDTETHPLISPNDEFADFYRWPVPEMEAKLKTGLSKNKLKAPDKTAEYARSALKSGLKLGQALGVNPFKVGLIGSTDMHSGLATVHEENFQGNSAAMAPGPERVPAAYNKAVTKGGYYAAAGLAAVWAKENTRESIFAAMQRREVYATTGPRILLQFFAGFGYGDIDISADNLREQGYAGGVPIGGDLSNAPTSPVLLIRAGKDPEGANLDRIQVIKGWLDKTGQLQEKIYSVATSQNKAGVTDLSIVWRDPNFNKQEPAFYYVRVLEIPTRQWADFDRERYDLKDINKNIPMMARERAYSSPIWYTP